MHTFVIVCLYFFLGGKEKVEGLLNFSVRGKRWSVIAFKHWGFPECLGRTWCCFCGARLLRSVRQQISGRSLLCCTGQFSTSLSKVGHRGLFLPHGDFVHEATLGNWSQNSGVARVIVLLAFCVSVCAVYLEEEGRVLTIYKYTSSFIPSQNGGGKYS